MQPRTKLQHRVLSLSKDLPKISGDQKAWAFKYCLKHIGYRTKKNVFCLDCGNIWDGDQKVRTLVCPACGTRLTIQDTRKKKLNQIRMSMAILDVVDGFQVVRIFEINSHHRAGQPASYHIWEVVQQWFVEDGKLTIIGRTCSFGSVGWSGDMEIRVNLSNYYTSNKYDLFVDRIYPQIALLPIYKRNGFSSKLSNIYPYSLLKLIKDDSKAETLIKAGQRSLLDALSSNNSSSIYRYWNSIKICIRQKYIVKNAQTYLDYLDLLSYFRKDLRSPKYVCTKSLKADHDRLVLKKRLHEKQQEDERRRKRIAIAEESYRKEKAKFFGLIISDGDLVVKVLETVNEFMVEGDTHKHCVFTNEYYDKQDSLCLSARIGDQLIETIEISLSKLKIEQSRGLRNNPTPHHDRIINLINKNMHLIKRRMKPLKAKKVVVDQVGAVA